MFWRSLCNMIPFIRSNPRPGDLRFSDCQGRRHNSLITLRVFVRKLLQSGFGTHLRWLQVAGVDVDETSGLMTWWFYRNAFFVSISALGDARARKEL